VQIDLSMSFNRLTKALIDNVFQPEMVSADKILHYAGSKIKYNRIVMYVTVPSYLSHLQCDNHQV
jgi:hypothetical protein